MKPILPDRSVGIEVERVLGPALVTMVLQLC